MLVCLFPIKFCFEYLITHSIIDIIVSFLFFVYRSGCGVGGEVINIAIVASIRIQLFLLCFFVYSSSLFTLLLLRRLNSSLFFFFLS